MMQDSGASRRETAETCLARSASFSTVMPRFKRASSIPETAVLERMGRGVLGRPVKPGDDSGMGCLTFE